MVAPSSQLFLLLLGHLDWVLMSAATNFPGSTYTANMSDPFEVNGDNDDDNIDIWNGNTIIDYLEQAGQTFTKCIPKTIQPLELASWTVVKATKPKV